MNLSALQVYASPLSKIRLGKDNDGGYIVCDDLEYDCFLSGGISYDTSFEEDFLRKYPHLICHAYDGSIDVLTHKDAQHIMQSKWIRLIWLQTPPLGIPYGS